MALAVALVASACGGDDVPSQITPRNGAATAQDAAGAGPGDAGAMGGLTLVLPTTDRLAPAERARVRLLVDRVLDEVITTGPRPTVLEPASTDALRDVIELSVRRTDTVCVLGRDVQAALEAALALYPSRAGCLLPHAGGSDARLVGVDVDLAEIGRALGVTARAAADDATVVVLDGGDGMLDRRWASGVRAGASDGAAVSAQHTVTSAAELLALLDAQQDSVAAGVVPGSPEALEGPGRGPVGGVMGLDDVPAALALPPVRVVVLDASVDAAALVDILLGRDLLVIAPRSLLVERSDDPGVVMGWRVRWDVPLALMLRQAIDGERPGGSGPAAGSPLDLLAIEAGPAAPQPPEPPAG